jgi:hypothetical protein
MPGPEIRAGRLPFARKADGSSHIGSSIALNRKKLRKKGFPHDELQNIHRDVGDRVIDGLLTASGISDAAWVQYSPQFAGGTSCRPRYQNGASNVTFEDRGAGNLSTSEQEVFCPLNLTFSFPDLDPYSLELGRVTVFYQDNSSSSNFSCYLYQTTGGGWQYWTTRKYTCSVGGGCDDVTSSFVGMGTLSFELPFDDNRVHSVNFGVNCSIAAGNGTWEGASWVRRGRAKAVGQGEAGIAE